MDQTTLFHRGYSIGGGNTTKHGRLSRWPLSERIPPALIAAEIRYALYLALWSPLVSSGDGLDTEL